MEFLRRKQKIIFWIVSIIVIFSFVVVWDLRGDYGGGRGGAEFEVGTVNGRPVTYREFELFRRRIMAAVGGMPVQFANAPGRDSATEEWYKYIFAMALLDDAEKAGCVASDMRVGTYLENGHPVISMSRQAGDPKALERAVDSYCRQMQMTRQDLIKGIRDWLTIDTYLNADSNLGAVNSDTVYTYYAFNRTEIGVKRFRVLETEELKEQAKKDVMDKPAEELDSAVRAHIAAMAEDPRYRTPSRWRFAYVLVPFVAPTSVRQPTDAEINEHYEKGKTTSYDDKPLEEVRERVKAELNRQEIERQTLRNLTIDVDPQLRSQGGVLDPAELVKLTQLVKYGVVAGATGEAAVTPAELLAALPAGADSIVQSILERLDVEDAAFKTPVVAEWRENYNLSMAPLKSDKGYFRLKLLDYVPSTPSEIEAEDGSVKPELRELAITDMVGERAGELVKERTAVLEGKLRELMLAKENREDAPDAEMAGEFDRQTVRTMSYAETVSTNYELLRMVVGDVAGPFPAVDEEGTEGLELIVMVERRLPGREMFDAEPVEVRNQFRDLVIRAFSGGLNFTYTPTGPAAVIQPSPSVLGSLAERFNRREIGVNMQLFDNTGGEG